MAFRSNVHGRMQFERDGKILGAFTVHSGGYDWVILAEFVVNKWQAFWTYRAEDFDLLDVLPQLSQNIVNFFSDQPATENMNSDATDIVSRL